MTRRKLCRRGGRGRHRGRGQTLVEFALVLPIFMLVLFGLIDMGRYVFMNSALSQAAREGARVGAVEASWMGRTDPICGTVGGPVCPADPTALRTDILSGANRMMSPYGAIAIADLYTRCDASPQATAVTTQSCVAPVPTGGVAVRVVMVFRPITPVISSLFPSITTQASATMGIN